jgi:aminodeoxyfutalosine deaminase
VPTPVSPAALAALPKVELHVHLEGSVTAATASALATRHGGRPEDVLVLEGDAYPRRYRNFMHFVDTFVATSRQLRTPEDLETVATDFARGQAAQGVRWTEATFTATTLVSHGWDPDELWGALRSGFAAVPEAAVGLIVDVPRDAGVAAAERTAELVTGADAPIVGLGLSGVEGSLPESAFRVLRETADARGWGLAVHAGETGTAANVAAAVDDLGADRIGHGIAVLADPALTARLAADGVVFELCPSSNVSLGLVTGLDEHPIVAMRDAGLALTVNSDDPPFFSTSLTAELAHADRLLALGIEGLATLQRRAARASFCDAALRSELLDAVDAWEREHAV